VTKKERAVAVTAVGTLQRGSHGTSAIGATISANGDDGLIANIKLIFREANSLKQAINAIMERS